MFVVEVLHICQQHILNVPASPITHVRTFKEVTVGDMSVLAINRAGGWGCGAFLGGKGDSQRYTISEDLFGVA